jgi:hypothetical protein
MDKRLFPVVVLVLGLVILVLVLVVVQVLVLVGLMAAIRIQAQVREQVQKLHICLRICRHNRMRPSIVFHKWVKALQPGTEARSIADIDHEGDSDPTGCTARRKSY